MSEHEVNVSPLFRMTVLNAGYQRREHVNFSKTGKKYLDDLWGLKK
jgi:hypothetical protein